MTKCAILQSNYIPWKGYFDLIASVDQFIIYDSVQYTKNDWRNRNRIKTHTGTNWISIPVKGSITTKINEVVVADPKWAAKHWRTISQSYCRAEYFHLYKDIFEEFYATIDEELLSVINTRLIRKICRILEIDTLITDDRDHVLEGDRVMRLIGLCQQIGATTYISGPKARNYINESQFAEYGIKLEWIDYSGYPEHQQLFPPFEHSVTILDLLFNEGPNATRFMKHTGLVGVGDPS